MLRVEVRRCSDSRTTGRTEYEDCDGKGVRVSKVANRRGSEGTIIVIIFVQGSIALTQTCEMYTIGKLIQIIHDEGSFDVSFSNDKKAEAALQVIKEEVKRQSSSCRCEIVIDINETREVVEKGK